MIADQLKSQNKTKQRLFHFSAVLSGLLLPFSFAPYNNALLVFPLLAWLLLITYEQKPKIAFQRGWLFGFGWFVHGVHWIYYSLHYHGGAPVIMAYAMVVMMAAVLALFPAVSLYAARRFYKTLAITQLLLILPLALLLAEWLRGYFLTGFPWVQIGVALIDTPLAGFAPLIGGLGVGWLATLVSGALVLLVLSRRRFWKPVVTGVLGIFLLGYGLQQISWTEPVDRPIQVSMIQGNIAQSEKWLPSQRQPTLEMYREQSRLHWESDLIIWPETAIPDFQHRVSYYLQGLQTELKVQGKDLLLGIFIRDENSRRYYNGAVSLRDGVYLKRHLVPLGEYFPFRGLLEYVGQWIRIPMSDVDTGPEEQALVTAAGQPLGISICFEDAFDREVLKSLPQATLLVNLSNDAWFEDSPEAWQHHQIARMRALETGRYMLRATNTGVSSIIDNKGEVVAISPQFERHVLTAKAQPMQGATPYVFWQNYLLMGLACVLLAGLWYRSRSS